MSSDVTASHVLAAALAQAVNGGKFVSGDFYSPEHRERWIAAVEAHVVPLLAAAAPASPPSAEGWTAPWPAGCPKNSSCARNRDCMYGCAAHTGRPRSDLAAEIDEETARRAAPAAPPPDDAVERVATGLLPCPFCGSANIDPEGWASQIAKGPACDDCGATAETVDVWNARAAISAMPAADEKLREALRFYADEENYSMGYYHPEDADPDHVESHGPLVLDDRGSRARKAVGEDTP